MFLHQNRQITIHWILATALAFIGFLAVPPDQDVFAQSYDVCSSGCSFQSIQAAINAASPGNTISIGPGTYQGSITLRAGVSLRGAGAATTILRSNGALPVILAAGGAIGRTTVVEELSVTNGGGPSGGGILVRQNAAPSVRNVAVYGNSAANTGGGVSALDGGDILLQGVRIRDNTAWAGAGLNISNHGRATVGNSVIENNQPSGSSSVGALHVTENSQLVMENTIVRGTTASFGGGMRVRFDSTATITGGRFENNTAIENGGAIFASNHSTLIMDGVVVVGNHAKFGGGLSAIDTTVRVTNCQFVDNQAQDSAGAIQAAAGTQLLVDATRFANNQAVARNAGAILVTETGGEIRNSRFEGNRAGEVGGAVHLNRTSDPLLAGNTLVNNQAKDGGGIHVLEGRARIIDNIVRDNQVTGYGAGVAINRVAYVVLRNNRIEHNRAGRDGGGMVFQRGSNGIIENNVISFNHAGSVGGGMTIFQTPSESILRNNRFEGNLAEQDGGAIQIEDGAAPMIENCDFVDNVASRYGGAVVVNLNSIPKIRYSSFIGNRAGLSGGAVFVHNGSQARIEKNAISANHAGSVGGGLVVLDDNNSLIADNSISRNEADSQGGGVYLSNSVARLNGNQIVDNVTQGNGGALVIKDASPMVTNNLVARNRSGAAGDGLYISNSHSTISNNTVADNDQARNGDGIFVTNSTQLVVSYNLVHGNGFGIRGTASQPAQMTRNCFFGNQQANYDGIAPGPDDFSTDPMLTKGALGSYYLAQSLAGQPGTSPLVDAISQTAHALGLDTYTTRTDGQPDQGQADVGFHYGRLPGLPRFFPMVALSN